MKQLTLLLGLLINLLTFAQPPVANFTVNTVEACVGEAVTLTNTSVAGASPITEYLWSSPGGQPESEE